MALEARLTELLRNWQDQRRRGRAPTAEELCRNCPELVDELKRRIEEMMAGDVAIAESHVTSLVPPILLANRASPLTPLDISGNTEEESAEASKKKSLALLPDTEPVPGYRLVEVLGRGGFGEAWRALGPGGFPVALKFLRIGEGIAAPEVRSLSFLKDIRHANLLSVFGAWQNADYIIIAMELADRTLLDRSRQLAAQGQIGIPFQELIDDMYDAAKGIDYLNEPCHVLDNKVGVSIQHRDIKPHNLFLVGGSVKVGDFGLARVLEQNWTQHSGSMTPAYAAPEFFQGQTSDRSDQYSLAVTYCHLRGGRLPFSGNIAQITAGHLLQPPNLKMLPVAERPVVAKALAKKPQDRWPNCRSFVRALAATQGALTLTPVRVDLPPLPPCTASEAKSERCSDQLPRHVAVLPEPPTAKPAKLLQPDTSPSQRSGSWRNAPPAAPTPVVEKVLIVPSVPQTVAPEPLSTPAQAVSAPLLNPLPAGATSSTAPWQLPVASAAASPPRGIRLVRPSPSDRARELQKRRERFRTKVQITLFLFAAIVVPLLGFCIWSFVSIFWSPGR